MKAVVDPFPASTDITIADLEEIARAILHARPQNGTPQEILPAILSAAIQVTGADMGTLQVIEKDALLIRVQSGFERPFLDYFADSTQVASSCGKALEAGERVVVDDVSSSEIFAGTEALDILLQAGVRSCQSTPLIHKNGTLWGVFSTHSRKTRQFSSREHDLLDTIAGLASSLAKGPEQKRGRLKTSWSTRDH